MSKQKAVSPSAATKSVSNSINRSRRNAATRKCLPKPFKVLFAGANRAEFRSILIAWQDGRKKVKETS